MNTENVDEMRLEMLRMAAICATTRECVGCPAHGEDGCFFVVGKLPPRRWMEKVNLREGVE